MSESTFTKRPGTTNKGGDYEILNIANISMNLVMDEKIRNFRISSNDKDFGDFDDIVVKTETQKGTNMHAIQLKLNSRGNLSLKQLEQARGDFSLKKYFDSVQTLKFPETKFILFTNLKIDIPNNTELRLEGEDFPIIVTKMDPIDISHKTNHRYKFSIGESGSYENSNTVLLYKKFLQNFFLYSGQENVHNLEHKVTEKFKTFFGGNDKKCGQYIQFLTKWGLEDGKKEKLDKKWIKLVIALNILSSHINPLSFNHSKDIEGIKTVNRNILREAIGAFDVTIFRTESYDDIKQLWNDGKCELIKVLKKEILKKQPLQKVALKKEVLKIVNKLQTKYQLASAYISDIDQVDLLTLSQLLWLLGKCPLILTQDESVAQAVRLCACEKFILLKDDSVNYCRNDVSVFKTLRDLKTKTSLYDQLVQNFTCSLQGKEGIRLERLIKVDEKIVSVLKTDDLLKMLKGPCGFGVSQEKLPDPYVERCVLKNSIDFKILDNITDETVIILDCVPQNNLLRTRLKSHTLININVEKGEIQVLNIENSNDEKSTLNTTIYLSEKRCKYEAFNKIYKTRNVKHFHQFRLRDDENLEWIRSKGHVSDIEKYKLSEYYSFKERDFDSSDFENNINLLISDPGMGKTELMKSFKLKCFPEYFTVTVDPKGVFSFLNNTRDRHNYVDAFKKFLSDEKYKWLSDRDKNVFGILLKKNKIVYVWDALDELSDKYRDIVIDIILELSNDCVQWVTSRPHLQNLLQNKFNVLSLNLNKFNENEQINYIQERLSDDKTTKEEIQMIIDKIKSSFALVEHRDILGIPLQLFMLTELLRQDREKYSALLNNFFPLTALYNYFIEEKMNILYKEKLGFDLNTSSAELLVQNQKEKILEEYTNAALRLLFPDIMFIELAVQHKIHETYSNIGVVTEIKDQIPRFLHNSFAEYLAARYFVSNLQHKVIQAQDLFDPKYTNVRFFFDLILTGDSQAHIAVLYKNFSFLKLNSDILTNKDCGGRSALHLACSWGQRYPELNVEYVGDNYIVDDEGQFDTIPDTKEYLETIDCLLAKCDIFESDEIHKMTPIEYARKSACRGAEMRTALKETSLDLKSTKIDHIIELLYYSAHYGYHYEFAYFFNELSIQVERNLVEQENNTTRHKLLYSAIVANIKNNAGMTLLYVAAKMGHVEIVKFLFEAGADINLADKDGMTPLYIASQIGNDKIVKFLLKADADINFPAKDGWTPLHVASENGNNNIVEFLLEARPDVNATNKNGVTPLYTACHNGNDKIVESLLRTGADVNLPTKYGWTPLNTACQNGNVKIVESLLQVGANTNAANKNGATPLYTASYNGNDKVIVELLWNAGADINLRTKNGWTPLNVACHNGYDRTVEFLLTAGADINLPTKHGWTPLNMASQNGNDEIVALLLEAGADTNATNKNGETPLYIASRDGKDKIVKFLLTAEADINLQTKDGDTPLNIAFQNGNDKIVDVLLRAGADTNAANKNGATPFYIEFRDGNVEFSLKPDADVNLPTTSGRTPLNIACDNRNEKIIDVLLKAGADINLPTKQGFTPLYIASLHGDNKIVEFLLEAGADINRPTEDGCTPLYIASHNAKDTIVKLLLKAGADLNLPTKYGWTPLNRACDNGNEQIVEILLKADADINLPTVCDWTPLNTASQRGNDKIVELLLNAGADANAANKNGATPLYIASRDGNTKIVKLLLTADADINLATKDGDTPLNIAFQNGNDKIVDVLLKAGADTNAANKNGATPFCIEFRDGNVEFLLKAGADVNLPTKNGWTPLNIAYDNGNNKVVDFLLSAGADINAANANGETPLYMASQNGNAKIVEFLLTAGADANLPTKDGATPLYIASHNGNDKIVERLLNVDADVNAANKNGWTPLSISCEYENDKIVELLLKKRPDINAANVHGETPLYVASQNGNDKIVECLLKAGADVNLTTKEGCSALNKDEDVNLAEKTGWTPLHIASYTGHKEIVVLLVESGADINAKTNLGHTPLQLALQVQHNKIVTFLKESGAI